MYDVVVVGGGAAGMIAAGSAAEMGASVLLLEKMEKPARKLRITGKGRCNITNAIAREKFLLKVRAGAEFVKYAFDEFDNHTTIKFLEQIGLELTIERGERVFPTSGRAQDVVNTIENWAKRENVEIRVDAKVDEIVVINSKAVGVKLIDGELIECKEVILATGGVSYPSTGSDGDGHEMADKLLHTIVELRPSLVPLVTDENISKLKDLELRNVNVKLMIDREIVDERFGEVVFYEKSIAGPTVIALSRTAVDAIIDKKTIALEIDLKPALTQEKIVERIKREISQFKDVPVAVLLDKLAPRQLHSKIAKQWGASKRKTTAQITESDIIELSLALKSLTFNIVDYRPFSEAIVTAGGVSTEEIDDRTMKSKLVENLYFAGELIDIDADTGGYNIQLAISTGRLAGKSAAEKALS